VVRGLLSNISVVGLFMAPMITMRLFAEEKRTGTLELLVTSPLRDYEIILGKWLAAVILYAAMLGLSLVNLVTLYLYGKPAWKPMLIGYLGLLLQGGCMLALGTFISACTKNQIVACVGAFGVLLLLWVISWTSSLDSTTLTKVVGYLSILDHLESFTKGVLDSKDAIFFASGIFLGLFLTGRAMESIRWRA
jgi:ABC-2 type transport system permease protein